MKPKKIYRLVGLVYKKFKLPLLHLQGLPIKVLQRLLTVTIALVLFLRKPIVPGIALDAPPPPKKKAK